MDEAPRMISPLRLRVYSPPSSTHLWACYAVTLGGSLVAGAVAKEDQPALRGAVVRLRTRRDPDCPPEQLAADTQNTNALGTILSGQLARPG